MKFKFLFLTALVSTTVCAALPPPVPVPVPANEVPLGAVKAVSRNFTPALADCKGKLAHLSSTKRQCVVSLLPTKNTDFLAKATNVDISVSGGCSINATTTLTGYVLTITTAVGGDPGGADTCLNDAYRFGKLPGPAPLSSLLYVL